MLKDVKVHPAAELFPMMGEDEYQQLKADIKENGQNNAVTYWGNMLLDGRNRMRACRELNIEPIDEELDEELVPDPYAWVVSQNLHRRHLTDQQRSVVAQKLATMKRGRNSVLNPPIGGFKELPDNKRSQPSNKNGVAISVTEAAAMLQVSPRSVERARAILKNGSDDVVAAVERNEISLLAAEKLTKEVKDKREQSKIVKQGKQAVAERLKQAEKPATKPKAQPADSSKAETVPSDLLSPIPLPNPKINASRKRLPELVSAYRRSNTKIEDLHVLFEDLEQDVRTIVRNWIS